MRLFITSRYIASRMYFNSWMAWNFIHISIACNKFTRLIYVCVNHALMILPAGHEPIRDLIELRRLRNPVFFSLWIG